MEAGASQKTRAWAAHSAPRQKKPESPEAARRCRSLGAHSAPYEKRMGLALVGCAQRTAAEAACGEYCAHRVHRGDLHLNRLLHTVRRQCPQPFAQPAIARLVPPLLLPL